MVDFARRALLATPALALGDSAWAQGFPTRPLNFIVQFGAGSSTDLVMRRLGEVVGGKLGQPVVITNKTGAGGMLGVADIARAAPDGYTIGSVNMPTLAIIPHLQRAPYDPLTAFHHIAVVQPYEYGLYCSASAPWQNWEEFVAYARANPGKLSYGSPGVGTTNHLVTERIGRDLGISWTHVPFRGSDAEIFSSILGGHIQFANGSRPAAEPQVKSGAMRLLLVTSHDRWDGLPEVPTMEEKGFSYFQASFFSIAAPAGLPGEARAKLDGVFREVLTDPAFIREAADRLSTKVVYQDGESYARQIREMHTFYATFLPQLGLT